MTATLAASRTHAEVLGVSGGPWEPVALPQTDPLGEERPLLSSARPADAIRHGNCGRWWTGARTAHCGGTGCHRTFSSTTAFDAHQRAGAGCLDPEAVGLVPVPRRWGACWSWPSDGRNPFAPTADGGGLS